MSTECSWLMCYSLDLNLMVLSFVRGQMTPLFQGSKAQNLRARPVWSILCPQSGSWSPKFPSPPPHLPSWVRPPASTYHTAKDPCRVPAPAFPVGCQAPFLLQLGLTSYSPAPICPLPFSIACPALLLSPKKQSRTIAVFHSFSLSRPSLIFFFFFFFWLCHRACGILVLGPGIEPTSPALEGKILTIGPPEKSLSSPSKILIPSQGRLPQSSQLPHPQNNLHKRCYAKNLLKMPPFLSTFANLVHLQKQAQVLDKLLQHFIELSFNHLPCDCYHKPVPG